MDLTEQFQTLKNHMDTCEKELNSLKGGRKASSARVRKSLMEIKKASHGMRGATTEFTKGLPTKPRAKKEKAVVEPVAVEPLIETPPKKTRKPRAQKPTSSE